MELKNLHSVAKTIGAKQTSKAINRDEVSTVLIGSDCDERIVEPLLSLCKTRNIPVVLDYTMAELGEAARIKVKAAAIGVLK